MQRVGKQRSKSEQRNCAAADEGGVVAKSPVQSERKVTPKYRVIERSRGKYSVETMCDVPKNPAAVLRMTKTEEKGSLGSAADRSDHNMPCFSIHIQQWLPLR